MLLRIAAAYHGWIYYGRQIHEIIGRTRKGLASALPGSGPKLVEDADALVLQETLTRFGLNSHHQRDLEVKRSEGPPAVDQAACHNSPTCTV